MLEWEVNKEFKLFFSSIQSVKMGKEIEGIIRVDPSKPLYGGSVSVYKDGECLGAIDPITLDKINLLKKSEGKTIRFKPELIKEESEPKVYVVKSFSIE